MNRGKYIVIEGPQGVGKTTQIKFVAQHLQAAGLPVRVLREPDSQSDLSARMIRRLTQDPQFPLNTRSEVLLYNAARALSLQAIRNSVEHGVICLVDRNYLTTLTIQYYGRGDIDDYETINRIIAFAVDDMEPDLTIVMDASPDELRNRAEERQSGERFDNLDVEFLTRVRKGYLWESKQRGFPVVDAARPPADVFKDIWHLVVKTLAEKSKKPIALATASNQKITDANQPLVKKVKNGSMKITKAGYELLDQAVSNSHGDVYAFTEYFSPVTVAAAMARLSRRADDMRITLLDEFAGQAGKDEKLLQRVITAYGDDSVQQLAGLHFVIENASNILTKKLEWGRLAAYLEQSTRYIYFDKTDEDGRYRYHVPPGFDEVTRDLYVSAMDQIFSIYSVMVHKLTEYLSSTSSVPAAERDGAWQSAIRAQACDAIRPVLPVSTRSTVGVFASAQALESLIMHLISDELPEAKTTGLKLLEEARKIIPTFLERADNPERGGALIAYRANTYQAMKDLTLENIPDAYGQYEEAVRLDSVWPRNEMELLPEMLYEHSNLSLSELRQIIDKWPYDKREKAFAAYMGERLNRRHKPGRALEKAHYSWDIVCDYGIFRDLQRHRMVDSLEWQVLTPRYGYEVPELVEAAGLGDSFEECFDISLKLHSDLVATGHALEAQYATLLGHRMRWKVTYNARQAFHFHELRTTPQGHPGYRKLVKEMHAKLCEVHPLIGSAMKFVNTSEDPELTRLAAERYTQFKLNNLT